jgi:vacuolar-type H+-ATPase subunit F/Vma7
MLVEENDDKIYNLLISKGIDGNGEYSKFVEKIYAKNDFLWKESVAGFYSSLSENFFNKIDVIIILSQLYSQNKEEFDKIIEAAIEFKKPIVVIKPQEKENLPENLEKIATSIVGWDVNTIIDTLKEVSENSPH